MSKDQKIMTDAFDKLVTEGPTVAFVGIVLDETDGVRFAYYGVSNDHVIQLLEHVIANMRGTEREPVEDEYGRSNKTTIH